MNNNDIANNTGSNPDLPLLTAASIELIDHEPAPEDIASVTFALVETPGEERGLFGPIVSTWRNPETKQLDVWAPGFTLCPHMTKRFEGIAESSRHSNNPIDSVASGAARKGGYSWNSLITASKMSQLWANVPMLAFMECITQASSIISTADLNGTRRDDRLIMALYGADDKQLADVGDDVMDFMSLVSPSRNEKCSLAERKRRKAEGENIAEGIIRKLYS